MTTNERLAELVAKLNGIPCNSEKTQYAVACGLEAIATLTRQLAEAQAELRKWQQPFDQEQFDAIKQQASHKDSLAAQGVYIIALEHALKHKEADRDRAREQAHREEVAGLKGRLTACEQVVQKFLNFELASMFDAKGTYLSRKQDELAKLKDDARRLLDGG